MRASTTRQPRAALARRPAPVLASGLLLAGLLTGCSSDGSSVDLSRLGDQIQQGIDDARGAVQDVQDEVKAAGLDESTRKAVEDAVSSASTAIDQARGTIATAGATAGPQAQAAVADAKTALADAKAKVDAAAAQAQGALKTGLQALSGQIDDLAARLDKS
ncbi:MAG TPA: hypothetical protein VGK35_06190 [Actinotalea sp.]|jgi:hypothetical protein